jgi:hypothetical protein
MPKGKHKDPRLTMLKREVKECEGYVKKAKDPKEKSFREEQLAKARADLAKYVQNKPE